MWKFPALFALGNNHSFPVTPYRKWTEHVTFSWTARISEYVKIVVPIWALRSGESDADLWILLYPNLRNDSPRFTCPSLRNWKIFQSQTMIAPSLIPDHSFSSLSSQFSPGACIRLWIRAPRSCGRRGRRRARWRGRRWPRGARPSPTAPSSSRSRSRPAARSWNGIRWRRDWYSHNRILWPNNYYLENFILQHLKNIRSSRQIILWYFNSVT